MNEITETTHPDPVAAAFERAVEAFKQFVHKLAEAIVPAIRAAAEFIREAFNKFLRAVFPKWWHISRHAKKKRIRKKYRDKMLRELRRWLK